MHSKQVGQVSWTPFFFRWGLEDGSRRLHSDMACSPTSYSTVFTNWQHCFLATRKKYVFMDIYHRKSKLNFLLGAMLFNARKTTLPYIWHLSDRVGGVGGSWCQLRGVEEFICFTNYHPIRDGTFTLSPIC